MHIWQDRIAPSSGLVPIRRRQTVGLLFAFFALLASRYFLAPTSHAQRGSPIQFQMPVHTRNLSGTVSSDDAGMDGIAGVDVKECTRDWKNCQTLAHTDENGRFSCPAIDGGTHSILFQKSGYIPLGFPVIIDPRAKSGFQVRLDPSN
jgi:hypothetical protein